MVEMPLKKDPAQERLTRWRAMKAKQRGREVHAEQPEQAKNTGKGNAKGKDTAISYKKTARRRSPHVITRSERLEEWKKRKELKKPPNKQTITCTDTAKPLISKTSKPRIDFLQKNKLLAAKPSEKLNRKETALNARPKSTSLPTRKIQQQRDGSSARKLKPEGNSDRQKPRRETFMVAQRKISDPRQTKQKVSRNVKKETVKSVKSHTFKRPALSTNPLKDTVPRATGAVVNSRRATVSAKSISKLPAHKSTKYNNVPSRIDSGLKVPIRAVKRKAMTPNNAVKRLRVETKTQKGVMFDSPALERNKRVQKEMSTRERLDNWLASHGKTPSRFKSLLTIDLDNYGKKDGNRKVDGGLSEADLNFQQLILDKEAGNVCSSGLDLETSENLDSILNEIETLSNEGCPPDTIKSIIDNVPDRIPNCYQSAKFWVCKARSEMKTGTQESILNVFDEAVKQGAQPPEEIAEALTSYLTETMILRFPQTPIPNKENIFQSSAVKFCLSKSTPVFKKMQTAVTPSTPSALITPVRRSTRKSHMGLPKMLKDHDTVVNALDDLEARSLSTALFVPNTALDWSDED